MPTMRGAVCGAGDEQDMFRALPKHGIPSATSGVSEPVAKEAVKVFAETSLNSYLFPHNFLTTS